MSIINIEYHYYLLCRKNISVLKGCMDPETVIDILYEEELIGHEDLQICRRMCEGDLQKSKAILEEIVKYDQRMFERIMEALKKKGEDYIVSLLTSTCN